MASLINEDQVRNLKSLFNEGFDDFVLLYFDDFEKKEKELEQTINNKDLDKIKKIAHALKGNSLNVGAIALADKCIAIEEASIKKNIEDILFHYNELEKIYPTVKQTYLHIVSTM